MTINLRTMLLMLVPAISLISHFAYAGKCEVTVRRTACGGKEAKAIEPYKNKAGITFKNIEGDRVTETTETKDAKNLEACLKIADKEKNIVRKGTLSEKVVTVRFDEKAQSPVKGTSTCD